MPQGRVGDNTKEMADSPSRTGAVLRFRAYGPYRGGGLIANTKPAVTLASCARAAEVMQLATVRGAGPSKRPQPILLEIAFMPLSVGAGPARSEGIPRQPLRTRDGNSSAHVPTSPANKEIFQQLWSKPTGLVQADARQTTPRKLPDPCDVHNGECVPHKATLQSRLAILLCRGKGLCTNRRSVRGLFVQDGSLRKAACRPVFGPNLPCAPLEWSTIRRHGAL